jgi:hypothetical protein
MENVLVFWNSKYVELFKSRRCLLTSLEVVRKKIRKYESLTPEAQRILLRKTLTKAFLDKSKLSKYLLTISILEYLVGKKTEPLVIIRANDDDLKIAKYFFKNYYICIFFKIFRKIFQIKLLSKELKNNDYFINFTKKI